MRKWLAELIGTFTLVFCGTSAIIINQETNGSVTHAGIAITFGLIVIKMGAVTTIPISEYLSG